MKVEGRGAAALGLTAVGGSLTFKPRIPGHVLYPKP